MTLRRNAAFSVVEVAVSGLGLFFIYRNVVSELGVAMLGVWSLVLATTAFGRMADVGLAAPSWLKRAQDVLQSPFCKTPQHVCGHCGPCVWCMNFLIARV